ncbi:LOW QUALITY PROTEIN: olfactory receptor 5J3-like [Heteronotia binoei]|uniref:LOW QUALITY PROTEIN: olfactory receptor 5J3-like n=1 Tax=Heteronotia binoei TaxID=13085 RepID=UPI00293039FC|nr:LOW QUALITY PROTEIN: olfactory receptor 5J3-like [Heteronotia binoei]
MDNQTIVTEFILLGLSSNPKLQILLFVMFLLIYLITLFGNLAIIVVIRVDPHLHTPMYFLLSYLSSLDIALSSVTVPKMLQNFLLEKKAVSIHGCFTQVFFVVCFSVGEGLLLSVMAYDWYIAICHPLHYTVMMNKQVCSQLICGALVTGFLYALLNTILLTTLKFCGPKVIHHFSCELPQLFKISCSNTFPNQMVIFTLGSFLGMGALFLTLASYIRIIFAVLKISSTEGKHKAFSTCLSHVTVVVLYYGTILFRYLKPTSKDSQDQEMAPSVVYFILTPMLNPIIYSLRNKEVKKGLLNMVSRASESNSE